MPIDASIPANIQQLDLGKVIGAAYQLRQMRDEMQTQNALRQLMAQPDAADPKTGLPTANTLAKLSRISPQAAAKLAGEVASVQERQAQTSHLQSETQAGRQKQDTEFLSSVVGDYDAEVKSGNTAPEIALSNARQKIRDHIMSAPVSDEEKQRAWEQVGSLDAAGLRNHALTAEQRLTESHEAERERHNRATEGAADKRLTEGKWQVLTDPKTDQQYRYNPETGEAKSLTGDKPFTPSGAQKLGGGATNPRSGVGAIIAAEMTDRKRKGLPPPTAEELNEIVAKYTMSAREGGAIGTRSGQTVFAVDELEGLIPPAREAYAKLDRTTFVPFNKLQQMYEKGLGNADQRRAYVAAQGAINAYARAVSPSGVPRESDIARADGMLNTADSPKAFNSALDQLKVEAEAIRSAGAKARDEGMADARAPKGGAQSTKAGIQEPKNKADFDGLPKGAHYRKPGDPPGTYRVKS